MSVAAIIRAEADLSRFSAEEADIAVRMIHACGAVEAANHIVFGPNLVAAARRAPPAHRSSAMKKWSRMALPAPACPRATR
jgi:precorrin isomerase